MSNYMRKLMESVTLSESAKDISDVVDRIVDKNLEVLQHMEYYGVEPAAQQKTIRKMEQSKEKAEKIAADSQPVTAATNPWSPRGTFYRGLGVEGSPEQVVSWVKKHWPRSNVEKLINEAESKAQEAGTEINWNEAVAMLRAKGTEGTRALVPAYMIVMNGTTPAGHDVTLYFDSTPRMATKKLIVDGQTMSGTWRSDLFAE